MNVNLRVAAKAVIVDDRSRVLILREAGTYEEGTNIGKWGLPGGRIENDEPFFDGLRREIREETGLEIEPIRPIYIGEWWPVIKGVKNHIVAMFILCKPVTKIVKLSEEHDNYTWLEPNNSNKFSLMAPDDAVIEKAFLKNE